MTINELREAYAAARSEARLAGFTGNFKLLVQAFLTEHGVDDIRPDDWAWAARECAEGLTEVFENEDPNGLTPEALYKMAEDREVERQADAQLEAQWEAYGW